MASDRTFHARWTEIVDHQRGAQMWASWVCHHRTRTRSKQHDEEKSKLGEVELRCASWLASDPERLSSSPKKEEHSVRDAASRRSLARSPMHVIGGRALSLVAEVVPCHCHELVQWTKMAKVSTHIGLPWNRMISSSSSDSPWPISRSRNPDASASLSTLATLPASRTALMARSTGSSSVAVPCTLLATEPSIDASSRLIPS